mmetsp:Transcript_64968/g.159966  ORF Transcript_64968/g.159966 Transcript_64968/m.159966 type:complete len:292 (-) Transcript_64968:359-1234(-)
MLTARESSSDKKLRFRSCRGTLPLLRLLLQPLSGPLSGVQAHVDVDRGVCEATHTDPVNARLGDFPYGFQTDTSRCFKLDRALRIIPHLDGLSELLGAHVVEQHVVNGSIFQREQGAKLVEIINLYLKELDLHSLAPESCGSLDCLRNPLRHLSGIQAGDVIVLDQNSVVQSHSVAVSSPASYGVFLEDTQARRGFARVQKLSLAILARHALDGLYEGACARRDAAHPPHGVEHRALQRENLVRWPGQDSECCAFRDEVAVLGLRLEIDGRGKDLDGLWDGGEARDDELGS